MVEWVRELDWRRVVLGSNPTGFGTLAILFTPLCQCLSEETLKAASPFYLVSMPAEVEYPSGDKCVDCRGINHSYGRIILKITLCECSQYRKKKNTPPSKNSE